ncbi:MAG: ATP-binding protein [Acidobacteriota bacterium]
MSLRVRLVLLTVVLVALVAIALSALQLQTLVDSLSRETISRATIAGTDVSAFLIDHINQHSVDYPPAEDVQSAAILWSEIVATDPHVQLFLLPTMTRFGESLVEINVAGESGQILASSNPAVVGTHLQPKESFAAWAQIPWYRRAYDLVSRRPDWEVSPRPIGIAEGADTVLQIQVVTSSVVVRRTLLPSLEYLATVSAGAILFSMIFTVVATTSALRPLKRIERTIDRITQGNFQHGESGPLAKEFQAVESKLDVLGQQIRGANENVTELRQKNLDVLVERVASQLDVAHRLSAISRLSSGVAHEIKNPLNAILLRLDLLKVRLGDSDEEVSEELTILSKEVLRLNRVVKTFLDFSRPVEVHFEDVDLAALARDVAELIKPQAAVAKIEVDCQVPDTPEIMRGDPDLIRQAVLNLVTNALEAMAPNPGHLNISVAREGDRMWLEVADSGPGIPPELRKKVFQLYFTSKDKGNGIGLAMTYRAVQLHNGTITFTSESGQGTTFRMEFPATVTNV